MKVPDKTTLIVFLLLLIVAFLFGRSEGQNELFRAGQTAKSNPSNSAPAQGGAGQQGTQGQANVTPTTNTNVNDEQWKEIVKDAIYLNGKKGAAVTIVEFTDYQCPYCLNYVDSTYPQIEKEYIDTGKVQYLLRDFPLPFHANAHLAAEAARCADDQGKYAAMHGELFSKQSEWSSGEAKDKFIAYASDLGLDKSRFSDCLDQGKFKDAVDKDLNLSQQLGIGGTPGFYINGKLLVGAQPYASFKQMIDAEL